MDDYLDDLSKEILRLYREKPHFNNYCLSDLKLLTNKGDYDLAPAIGLLRRKNYLVIDPTYAALHPNEIEMLGDSVAMRTPLRITREGLIALEKDERFDKRFRFNEIRAWITLGIAILGLIVAVISLLWQIWQQC